MKLTEAMTAIITNIIIKSDTIKMPKLNLLRACVRIIAPYFKLQLTEALFHFAQTTSFLCKILIRAPHNQILDQIRSIKEPKENSRFTMLSCEKGGTKQVVYESTPELVANSFVCCLISQCQLGLQSNRSVNLVTKNQFVGCRRAAVFLAKNLSCQYFEITTDDFDAQIENAIRLNKVLLFYCSKYKCDSDSWLKMVEFGRTGDIFSLISIERALKVIDPRGYLTTKHKVKATAVIELQKRFQKAKVILVQDSEVPTDCVTIRVNKWTEQDWVDYLQFKTKHLSIDENCKIVSHFIANLAKQQFSPSLINQMLTVNHELGRKRFEN